MSEVIGEGVIRIRTDESGVNVTKTGKDAGAAYSKGFTSSLKGIAATIGVTLAAKSAVDFVKGSLGAARESAKIAATTEQIIKSTGGTANVTGKQVGDLTSALSMKVGVDDELIQSGANLILTFKNVQNAGEGVDAIFDRTTAAAVDLAAAGFGSVTSASLQLGKALNDPIKGIAALSRSGVTFTEVQKAQIKSLVEQGDLLSAQKIILQEVESQVGGVAEATATAGDRAKVAFGNMQETIGKGLLPVVDRLANIFTDDVVPAVTATVGAVGDAVHLFGELPGPVKTAAVAFLALKAASSLGILGAGGDLLRRSLSATTSGMDSLRIRTLLASGAFTATRESGGRLASIFAGIRAGATGAGAVVRGFAVAALPIAILTAGITLWSKYSQGQARARQRVEDMTAALDQQTGALTDANEELAFKSLQESGAIESAKELGINLNLVRDAALGNAEAQAALNRLTDDYAAVTTAAGDAVNKSRTSETLGAVKAATTQEAALRRVTDAVGLTSSEVSKSQAAWKDQAEFQGKSADATDGATDSMGRYTIELGDAKDALKKLIDAENERREDLIGDRRDAIALRQALKDAREEARKGAGSRTGTQAEKDANELAILDLVDQFNSSTNEVRRAEFGATRRQLLLLAGDMEVPRKEAERLAALLRVPQDPVNIKFQSEGYQELVSQINAVIAAQARLEGLGAAGAGPLRTDAPATSTGPTRAERRGGEGRNGITIRIDKMMPHNYSEFERQTLEMARAAALGGKPVPVG